METPVKTTTKERVFQVGVKRSKRFKAGAEIGGPVSLQVDISETETDQDYSCHVTIRIV